MPRVIPLTLTWPTGGLNRRSSFQAQPPYTTADAENVRADAAEGRTRGGSRPGLEKEFSEVLGGSTASTGTLASISYDSVTDKTTITASSGVFTVTNVGKTITFDNSLSGSSYVVSDYTSTTVIKVTGNAAADVNSTVFGTTTTTVSINDALFTAGHASNSIVLDFTSGSPGNSYTCSSFGGTKLITVSTDPSSEDAGSTLTILDTFTIAGVEINMLSEVDILPDGSGFFFDNFATQKTGTIPSSEISATWSLEPNHTQRPFADKPASTVLATSWETLEFYTIGRNTGAVHDALGFLQTANDEEYTVNMRFDNRSNNTGFCYYELYVMMNDTTPDSITDGVVVSVKCNNVLNESVVTVTAYDGGSATTHLSSNISIFGGTNTLKVVCNQGGTANKIQVFVGGVVLAPVVAAVGAGAGDRFGFGCDALLFESSELDRVYSVSVNYTSTEETSGWSRRLIAASNGRGYYENGDAQLVEMTYGSSSGIDPDRMISATRRSTFSYIADYSNMRHRVADWGFTNTAGTTIDSTISNTMDADITADGNWGLVITNAGTSGVTVGQYVISGITPGTPDVLTIANAGTSVVTVDVQGYIMRTPKKFDTDTATLSVWSATSGLGAVPWGNPLIALWRDRIVLAGDVNAPHEWYMSRSGDPNDWDYSGKFEDAGRAIAGQNSNAGRIGEPVTSIIPGSDDYMVFGCSNSLWMMRGDPAMDGIIINLSHTVGCYHDKSWLQDPNGTIYGLGKDGVWVLAPGASANPQSFSREPLPGELININLQNTRPLMEWDLLGRGFWIFLTPLDDISSGSAWFFDVETKSFWPMRYTNRHMPASIHYFRGSNHADAPMMLLGGKDGFIRKVSSASTDDGIAFDSYCFLGPFRFGNSPIAASTIQQIIGVLGDKSGPVNWALYVGDSAEEALNSGAVAASGTWDRSGRNTTARPRSRCSSVYIKLSNASTEPWMLEEIELILASAGKVRIA